MKNLHGLVESYTFTFVALTHGNARGEQLE